MFSFGRAIAALYHAVAALLFSWKTFGSRPGRRAHLPRKSLEDVNPFRRIETCEFFFL